MSINKIKNRLKENSKQDNSWIERAKYRKENKAWLDISFAIAVKIMSALKANKIAGISPKTQKELAVAMDCSPQYVNKLLKGTENLQLETITKLEQILDINLIQVPEFEATIQVQIERSSMYTKSNDIINGGESYANYEDLIGAYSYENEPNCILKLVA